MGTALMFGDLPVRVTPDRTDLRLGSFLTIPQQHPFILAPFVEGVCEAADSLSVRAQTEVMWPGL